MTMANATMTSPPTNGVSSRKTNKPLMEKRRRARINDSLSQLKSLVIQSSKKDSSQFNKLEKADILELTVKYLRNLQNQQHMQQQQQSATANGGDISLAGKYQAGFMECANEVIRYLGQSQGFTDDIKSRVVGHLASCVQLASKSSFSKPHNNINTSGQTNAASAAPAQQQATAAQLPNGQIIQIVNGSYHQLKQFTPAPAPVQITSSPANVSTTATSHVAVSAAASPVSASSPFSRYTQPLHIQIPPNLSPVLIQSKHPQPQKMSNPQQQQLPRLHEVTPQSVNHLPAPQQEKVISSSSSPCPHLRERSMSPISMRHPKHLSYYTHEDDYIPRSRTYSMTSSSSDSELISPLNLSQSPQYYDSRKENNYSSKYPVSHQEYHQRVPLSANDRISPGHYILSDKSVFSHCPSNFASVIVDGRKNIDGATLKYMSMVMEDERHCIRHEESTSPASSVGEDRLWRPW